MNLTTKFERIDVAQSKKEKENLLIMNNNKNYYEPKIDENENIQNVELKIEIENNNQKLLYLEDMDDFLKNHYNCFQKISISENDNLMEKISKNLTMKNIMVF